MIHGHCTVHPGTRLLCPACMGARNKGKTSPARVRASKENARKGGRPKTRKENSRAS